MTSRSGTRRASPERMSRRLRSHRAECTATKPPPSRSADENTSRQPFSPHAAEALGYREASKVDVQAPQTTARPGRHRGTAHLASGCGDALVAAPIQPRRAQQAARHAAPPSVVPPRRPVRPHLSPSTAATDALTACAPAAALRPAAVRPAALRSAALESAGLFPAIGSPTPHATGTGCRVFARRRASAPIAASAAAVLRAPARSALVRRAPEALRRRRRRRRRR